jgi:glycogen debranching enzyme
VDRQQHQRKEKILTQPDPAKIPTRVEAVVLKQGDVFLLSNERGEIPWERPHALGLYYQDCRYLDGYTLRLNGRPLTPLSYIDARGFETQHDLANPALPGADGSPSIPKNTIGVRRQRLIRGGALYELIAVSNYGCDPRRLMLELGFRADFADIFVVKGFVQKQRGRARPPRVVGDRAVELCYEGEDRCWRTTRLVFAPAPAALTGTGARFDCSLAPGESREFSVRLEPLEGAGTDSDGANAPAQQPGPPSVRPDDLRGWLERAEAAWLEHSTEVCTANPLFDRVLRRMLLDLRLLRTRLDGLRYFAAGIPWFATLFGRDAATVAFQTLPYGPAMARETLRLLARYQATACDDYRDAEPGKVLHEFRTGELAQAGEIPQSPAYYGTVDATLLFLILMAEYVDWSGDLDLARELRPHLDAALTWIERYADHDGDGYLDYVGRYRNGLINQGWKDSGNAIVNADGSLAEPPIALCEVQGYTFRAWRQMARLLRALGDAERAAALDRQADALRERFERDFWAEELGCYVLALQQGGRPAAVVASNAGQVLWSGVASREHAARVAERLFAADMFSGWGIRTLSDQAAAYNPISYHLGSVWPHDNALILGGLRRYGHDAAALRVFDALFDAAASFADYRMPELYCGFARRKGEPHPVRYPTACSPQAWAAGALPHALWNLLGLRADALHGALHVVRPRLPAGLDWLELHGVPVGQAKVDLRFERRKEDGTAQVKADVREGKLTVLPTEDLPSSDRFALGEVPDRAAADDRPVEARP